MFVNPMIAFIGVLISWDMLVRKVLLAESALLALSKAPSNSLLCCSSLLISSWMQDTPTKALGPSSAWIILIRKYSGPLLVIALNTKLQKPSLSSLLLRLSRLTAPIKRS